MNRFNQLTIAIFIMVNFIAHSQDFYASYDKTYSVDTTQVIEMFDNRFSKVLKDQHRKSEDSLQLNNQMELLRSMIFAQINESVKQKRSDIISTDSITLNRFYSKDDNIVKRVESFAKTNKKYKSEYNLLKVWENRCSTKVISGYKCFKVNIVYTNTLKPSGYGDIEYLSLFVTDKIKGRYNHIVNFESILNKYYPLEIIEESEMVKGFTTKYTLRDLKVD